MFFWSVVKVWIAVVINFIVYRLSVIEYECILSTVRRLRRSQYFRVNVNKVQVVLSTDISRRPMKGTGLSGCW